MVEIKNTHNNATSGCTLSQIAMLFTVCCYGPLFVSPTTSVIPETRRSKHFIDGYEVLMKLMDGGGLTWPKTRSVDEEKVV